MANCPSNHTQIPTFVLFEHGEKIREIVGPKVTEYSLQVRICVPLRSVLMVNVGLGLVLTALHQRAPCVSTGMLSYMLGLYIVPLSVVVCVLYFQ